ncbi:MAG: aldehyde dehydrogenase family protein, partial [Thermomicrobiales bacterium]|nr:aldehyde dehydrogenase family protein [Thermomicrobiales bacterium]
MAALVSELTYPSLLPRVAEFVRGEHKLLIGGAWVSALSGETFGVVDPATGLEIARAQAGDAPDVDLAVAAARRAFDGGDWPGLSPADRGKLLWRLAELIDQHTEELAQLEALDNGKPASAAREADVPGSASMFRYFAGWADKVEGNFIPLAVTAPDTFHAYTRREPVGVCAQIIPWNYPLMMAAWKLAPALAVGCTVVLKPAEQTPLSALYLGKLVQEAGFPDGVVNIVTGFGETAGAALSAHPDVDKI